MNELQKKISEIGVVPVIKLSNPTRDAKPLADALCAGGVPVAEVTFRAAGAADAIRIMAESHPEMLVNWDFSLHSNGILRKIPEQTKKVLKDIHVMYSLNG